MTDLPSRAWSRSHGENVVSDCRQPMLVVSMRMSSLFPLCLLLAQTVLPHRPTVQCHIDMCMFICRVSSVHTVAVHWMGRGQEVGRPVQPWITGRRLILGHHRRLQACQQWLPRYSYWSHNYAMHLSYLVSAALSLFACQWSCW